MDRNKNAREQLKERNRPKKIVIYGTLCNHSTGNGKLIYHLAKALQKGGNEVFTIGMEYDDIQIYFDDIPILPGFFCDVCGQAHKGSDKQIQKVANWLNQLRTDYFICVGDPYHFQQFGVGNIEFKHIKTLMYTTIDSEGVFCNQQLLKSGKMDYLTNCDKVISAANFTSVQLKEWLDIDSETIYETIDFKNYKPVNEGKKLIIKKKYRFKKDDFVMYYMGRNCMRKRVHTLIESAAKFICETENTYLYLNIPPIVVEGKTFFADTMNPVDFVKKVLKKELGRDLESEGRIIFIGRGILGSNDFLEDQMAELYQLSDLFLCSTGGEGFGLGPVESMACGVPAIVPDNSTGREIIGVEEIIGFEDKPFIIGAGGLLTMCPTVEWINYNLKQRLTTTENTLAAIKFLYDNPEQRKIIANRCRAYVEEKFSQERFVDGWNEAIKNTHKKLVVKKEPEKVVFKKLSIKQED